MANLNVERKRKYNWWIWVVLIVVILLVWWFSMPNGNQVNDTAMPPGDTTVMLGER